MKKETLIITIISLLLFAGAVICLGIYSKETEQKTITNKTQEECVHDWVVTSRHNILTKSYKMISKCSKCGKEVKIDSKG